MVITTGAPPKGKSSFAKATADKIRQSRIAEAGLSAEALAKAGKLSGSVTEGAVLQGFAAGCLLDAEK